MLGALKIRDWKMQDWKMRDHNAEMEGLENAGSDK